MSCLLSCVLSCFLLCAFALFGNEQKQDHADDVNDDEDEVRHCVIAAGSCQGDRHDDEGALLDQRSDGRNEGVRRGEVLPAVHGNNKGRHKVQQTADAKADEDDRDVGQEFDLREDQEQQSYDVADRVDRRSGLRADLLVQPAPEVGAEDTDEGGDGEHHKRFALSGFGADLGSHNADHAGHELGNDADCDHPEHAESDRDEPHILILQEPANCEGALVGHHFLHLHLVRVRAVRQVVRKRADF